MGGVWIRSCLVAWAVFVPMGCDPVEMAKGPETLESVAARVQQRRGDWIMTGLVACEQPDLVAVFDGKSEVFGLTFRVEADSDLRVAIEGDPLTDTVLLLSNTSRGAPLTDHWDDDSGVGGLSLLSGVRPTPGDHLLLLTSWQPSMNAVVRLSVELDGAPMCAERR